MKEVAIVYHYLAHYRYPIFSRLMMSTKINFTLLSGNQTDISIKQIDYKFAGKCKKNGGLNWLLLHNYWFLKKRLLWQSGLLSTIITKKYDSVIFLGNPYHISTWIAIIICKIRKIKVMFWMHGFYNNKIQFKDYVKLYVFYKLPNAIFLYGNRSKERMASLKITELKNLYVIYNSLDYDSSLMFRKKLDKSRILDFRLKMFGNTNIPTICFIGRVNKIKKVNYLIEVQNKNIIKYESPLFNLLIMGDGEDLNSLKESVFLRNDHINSVKFLGEIYSEKEIGENIFFSDLCVTPGEIGLTAMHSLSYGTPVISHDNLNIQMPEVEAIIPGYNGDLYVYENINDLEVKIFNWITKYPIKKQEIVDNCYTLIDKYYNPAFQSKLIEETILTYV